METRLRQRRRSVFVHEASVLAQPGAKLAKDFRQIATFEQRDL
jgi:hypothetical protein